jgi:hypothetical protein
VIVTTPEEMPVTETLALIERLEPETGVTPTLLVANRVLPERFDPRHREVFDALSDADAALVGVAGRGVTAVLAAARTIEARRDNGERHLARLREDAPELRIVEVPELFTRATGRRVVALVADALDAQIGSRG